MNVRRWLVFSFLLCTMDVSCGSAVSAVDTKNNGNVVFQLFGYVKDSLVRTVDGTKEMWANHGRCNKIRSKQKLYRDNLKERWESEEEGLTRNEIRKRLKNVNGGISFDEYNFLSKGREDRGKLWNMCYLMFAAPRFLPYVFMFFPDWIPSPLAPLPSSSDRESKVEKLSRLRSHAVIQTLVSLENDARKVPALARLNIFGGKKQRRTMDNIDRLGRSISRVFADHEIQGDEGARLTMKILENHLYVEGPISRGESRLVSVPGSIVFGLMSAINGPVPFSGFLPNFMRRGRVVGHVQKIAASDNFLVETNMDISSLSSASLLEACNDRMIGGPSRSDEDLRRALECWLDLAVKQPIQRVASTGEEFNGNLARIALLSYYSVSAARDARSSSYLPRLMFQGHLLEENKPAE